MPLRIFLSHAKEDRTKVRELREHLLTASFLPWMDEYDLLPGQEWKIEITQVIAKTDVFIFCLSEKSMQKKGYIQAELKFALEQALLLPQGQIFIIPLKFESCPLPFSLQHLQSVDYFKESEAMKFIHRLKQIQQDGIKSSAKLGHQDLLESYRPFFSTGKLHFLKKRLREDLLTEPYHPLFNLLLCVVYLRDIDLTMNNLSSKVISEIEQRLDYPASDDELAATATLMLALIKHDYYESRFRATRPSAQELIQELLKMEKKPEPFFMDQLNCSRPFSYKIKSILK